MTRFPWFPFYAADFLNSRRVRLMSLEAVGAYILLLGHQWDGGALPDTEAQLALLLGVDEVVFHRLWPQLSPCFVRTPMGLVNERLDEIRQAQQDRHDKLAAAGKLGAKTRWDKS